MYSFTSQTCRSAVQREVLELWTCIHRNNNRLRFYDKGKWAVMKSSPLPYGTVGSSLSSIPLEHFLPHYTFGQLFQGYGSARPYTWVLWKYDIGAPRRKIFVSDLKGVKNDWFSPMYPDFNVWKKVGHYSAVQDNTVMQVLPSYEEPQCHIFTKPTYKALQSHTLGTADHRYMW